MLDFIMLIPAGYMSLLLSVWWGKQNIHSSNTVDTALIELQLADSSMTDVILTADTPRSFETA